MISKKMNEDKIREYFEKKVIDSGHTFEGSINKRLNKLGLRVKNEEFYYDEDEKKGRNIDFLAIDNVPSIKEITKKSHEEIEVSGQIRFFIECKSLPNHGWIFFGNEEHESDFVYNSEFSSESVRETIFDLLPDIPEPKIYFASTYSEYIHSDGKKKNKYTKDNNLYESTIHLIKAMSSSINENKKLKKYFATKENKWALGVIFFQPVVVFNGHMYRSTHNKNDDVHLTPIDIAKIRRQYVSPNYTVTEGTIHVISADKLEKYVKMMRKYYWEDDFIRKYQKELVVAHKNSMKE